MIPTSRVVDVKCLIAGRLLTQEFVIASIVEPVLLGLDFIRRNRAVWDFERCGVMFMDDANADITTCSLPNPLCLPPKSLQCCMVQLSPSLPDGNMVMVQPECGVEILDCVGTVRDGQLSLCLVNSADYEEWVPPLDSLGQVFCGGGG